MTLSQELVIGVANIVLLVTSGMAVKGVYPNLRALVGSQLPELQAIQLSLLSTIARSVPIQKDVQYAPNQTRVCVLPVIASITQATLHQIAVSF